MQTPSFDQRGPTAGRSLIAAPLHLLLSGCLALAVGACTRAPHQPANIHTDAAELAFVNVTVLALDGSPPKTNRSVLIRNGTIVALGTQAEVRIPGTARRIDASGKFLLPALWDMHVHLFSGTDTASLAQTNDLLLGFGITGVRDMGSYLDSLRQSRVVESGLSTAPRLYAAGPLLDGPKFQWSQAIAWHLTRTDEVTVALDSLQHAGVDFFKVCGSLSRPVYFAIARESRRRHVPFAGHIPNGVKAQEASDSGQRTLEHAGLDLTSDCMPNGATRVNAMLNAWISEGPTGKFREQLAARRSRDPVQCATLYARFRANGTWITPTMVLEMVDSSALATPSFAYLDSAAKAYCRGTVKAIYSAPRQSAPSHYDQFRKDIGALDRAGVPLLAGTDINNPCLVAGSSLHDELVELVRAGLTPESALRAATVNPARALGLADSLGGIAVGMRSDLLLLDANPLTDIRASRAIAGVLSRGTWYPARPCCNASACHETGIPCALI